MASTYTETDGRNTGILLAPYTFTDVCSPQWFVNFEDSGNSIPNTPGYVYENNHFGAIWDGIAIDCNNRRDPSNNNTLMNPGSAGLRLRGAQGTRIGSVVVGAFGTYGVDTSAVSVNDMWIEGDGTALGPGLITNDNIGDYGFLSIEHINYARQGAPYWFGGATPPPYMYLSGPGAHFTSLNFEDSTTTGPANYIQFAVQLAFNTSFGKVTVNTTPNDAANSHTNDSNLFAWASNIGCDFSVQQVYCRGGGVPVTVYDGATGQKFNAVSFDSSKYIRDLTVGNLNGVPYNPLYRQASNVGYVSNGQSATWDVPISKIFNGGAAGLYPLRITIAALSGDGSGGYFVGKWSYIFYGYGRTDGPFNTPPFQNANLENFTASNGSAVPGGVTIAFSRTVVDTLHVVFTNASANAMIPSLDVVSLF